MTTITDNIVSILLQKMISSNSGGTTVPTYYNEKVAAVKELLVSDITGLVNTVLDFSIASATVEFKAQTSNKTLTKSLNKWLENINIQLIGDVPIGVTALSKEYYRERWKASSFLMLKTIWQDVDGILLPTKMMFLDGQSIRLTEDSKTKEIGNTTYELVIDKNDKTKNIPLLNTERVHYFRQFPYEAWGEKYPNPFLIARGIWKNAKILELISSKGEEVIREALAYLFLMKKGSEGLATKGMNYGDEDYKKVAEDFTKLVEEKKQNNKLPSYTTGFDTDISHIIPEYEKVMNNDIYAPKEQAILAGLGMVEIYNTSNRKEVILNPKPLMSEVTDGVSDFKSMIMDVMRMIVIKNCEKHRKYSNVEIKKLISSPIKPFVDTEVKKMLRSAYDRGQLSHQTFIEIVAEQDYEVEKTRREQESANGEDDIFYPHIITNVEKDEDDVQDNNTNTEDVPDDKKGIEKDNFTVASKKKKNKKKRGGK